MEIPEHLDLDVSRMQMNDTLRLSDLSAPEGVKLLDDPEETVLASVVDAGARGRARAGRGRGRRGRGGSRARKARPPRARRASRPAAKPRRRVRHLRGRKCASSSAGTRPRRSTCSSSASATRAASTRRTATTSAGWSSTSSPAVTAARFRGKFSGQLAEVRDRRPSRSALLKPELYMNLSGRSVAPAARFFKVPPEQLLVVHDEGDFDLGRLQARAGGGLAGHNGLRSIAQELGTQEFLRLRIGVGPPRTRRPAPARRLRALELRAARRRRGDRLPRGRRGRDASPARVSSPRSAASTKTPRELR